MEEKTHSYIAAVMGFHYKTVCLKKPKYLRQEPIREKKRKDKMRKRKM